MGQPLHFDTTFIEEDLGADLELIPWSYECFEIPSWKILTEEDFPICYTPIGTIPPYDIVRLQRDTSRKDTRVIEKQYSICSKYLRKIHENTFIPNIRTSS